MKWLIEHRPSYSLLKVFLEPGESVTAEAGAMMLMKGDVEVKTHTGGGFVRALLRAVAATESFFVNTYIARSSAEIWFAPGVPGDIAAIELKGDEWVVQDTSYLAHSGDIELSVAWRGFKGLFAEGELVWLKLRGRGVAWVNSYGAIEKVELGPGERIVVDNFHFVAMPANTSYRVRKFGGLKSFLFGGEGIVIEIEGPTTLYLQTRILPPFAYTIKRYIGR